MIHIALHQPEIPPNTGNIIRLCANSGAELHLIHPLGFKLEDKRMRRAGLDYHEWAEVKQYPDDASFLEKNQHRRIIACTTKATTLYSGMAYQAEDILLFGAETKGLPEDLRAPFHCVKIPMRPESRSLNLSNAVAIILYEAWRQLGFACE